MSHVTTHARFCLGICCALNIIIAGCEAAVNQVRIEPGTTPLKPVFVLTDTTGRAAAGAIYGLSVVPCGADTAIWQIAATGSNGPPSHIQYGETPEGYVVHTGPAPLRPGCFDVFVTDGRRARFRVDAAGHVLVDAAARHDTLSR